MSDELLSAAVHGASDLLAARLQMAFTLAFHIVLASLGVGLPVLMLFAEWRFLRTGDPVMLEGTAFFLEAIFVGIYLYSWDRLPPKLHWWSGVPVAIGGLASAWFVVTANAWMNVPQGFSWVEGAVLDADPIVAMLNPATAAQTTHMIIAAYMVTGLLVASVYAAARLRGRESMYHWRAMGIGLALGASLAPAQMLVGHWAAKVVAATQPVKLAAMEGQFRTESGAPLRLGGVPDEPTRQTRFAIEIPGGLSWLAYGNSAAEVRGLDDFPWDEWPPVFVVHVAFQVMVLGGVALLSLGCWAGWSLWRRGGLPQSHSFLWGVTVAGPVAVLALQAGWVVTEVGRQPWIVQGVMRTADAVTDAPGIRWLLATTLVIYAILTLGSVMVLRLLARQPLAEEVHDA